VAEIKSKSTIELMNVYADILNELISRKVVRTYNSPVGDYAEWLVAEKLNLTLESNSQKGFDAYELKTKKRFQIKSRWERGNPSRQSRELNVIRNYEDNQFDYLIVLIFDKRFFVKEAYSIPHEVIREYARYSKHQNGYILIAMGQVLHDNKVEDITYKLR
jgi:hypothetical protein